MGRINRIDREAVLADRSFLAWSVNEEEDRLSFAYGAENAPLGGWRNRAVNNVASREGMNPYALDRIIRGLACD
jgi:hypothetical protein